MGLLLLASIIELYIIQRHSEEAIGMCTPVCAYTHWTRHLCLLGFVFDYYNFFIVIKYTQHKIY